MVVGTQTDLKTLQKLIGNFPFLELRSTYSSYSVISPPIEPAIELAFIRLGLPEINGFLCAQDFLSANPNRKVIYYASQNSYAVEAFEHAGNAFLLLPFKVEKFEMAISSVTQ
jgi:DNA-binding LytR/AlgR family response regulator